MLAGFFDYFNNNLPSGQSNLFQLISNIIDHDQATPEEAEQRARRLHTYAAEVHAQIAFEHFSKNFIEMLDSFFRSSEVTAIAATTDRMRKVPIMLEGEPCALSFRHAETKVLRKQSSALVLKSARKGQGVKGPGKPSQWTSSELSSAIKSTLTLLPPSERSYGKVNEILKTVFGERAPETPEALRKLITRFGLNWKKLKTDIISSNNVR